MTRAIWRPKPMLERTVS